MGTVWFAIDDCKTALEEYISATPPVDDRDRPQPGPLWNSGDRRHCHRLSRVGIGFAQERTIWVVDMREPQPSHCAGREFRVGQPRPSEAVGKLLERNPAGELGGLWRVAVRRGRSGVCTAWFKA